MRKMLHRENEKKLAPSVQEHFGRRKKGRERKRFGLKWPDEWPACHFWALAQRSGGILYDLRVIMKSKGELLPHACWKIQKEPPWLFPNPPGVSPIQSGGTALSSRMLRLLNPLSSQGGVDTNNYQTCHGTTIARWNGFATAAEEKSTH